MPAVVSFHLPDGLLYRGSLFQCVHLLIVPESYRVPDGTDCVEQAAVAQAAIPCADLCRFGGDQMFGFQTCDILPNGIHAHPHCFADGFVSRVALVGFSVFAVEQVGIYRDLSRVESQREHFIGQRRKIFVYISLGYVTGACEIFPEKLFCHADHTPYQIDYFCCIRYYEGNRNAPPFQEAERRLGTTDFLI